MKQLLFMIAVTLAGTAGVFVVDLFWGVWVYYFFAVLRPQALWEWSLPDGVNWSRYVAVATLVGFVAYKLGLVWYPSLAADEAEKPRRLTQAHWCVLAFGAWIIVCYFVAPFYNPGWTDTLLLEYLKIFVMFFCSSFIITRIRQLWHLYLTIAVSLGYIAYEMNHLYLFSGYLSFLKRGYAGLDNNGAALMLAMGIPLCLFAWEGLRRWYRWGFLLFIPLLIHAVLMSYSRGAMVAMVVASPLWLLRCQQKIRLGLVYGVIALLVPVMAGKEIQERFFSIEQHDVDETANSRRKSWEAGIRMANDYPIFGVGLRCANLLSYSYGADMEGRTIHSQYFQTAADNGWVGLAIFLIMIGGALLSLRRARRLLGSRTDDESYQARAIASGVEGSLAVFCVGAAFLSLEVFELPYLLLLVMVQLPVVKGVATASAPPPTPAELEAAATPDVDWSAAAFPMLAPPALSKQWGEGELAESRPPLPH